MAKTTEKRKRTVGTRKAPVAPLGRRLVHEAQRLVPALWLRRLSATYQFLRVYRRLGEGGSSIVRVLLGQVEP